MASPFCLRCLKRSLRSIDGLADAPLTHRAPFSTSTPSLAAAAGKGASGQKKVVAGRQGTTLRLAKNTRATTSRPPAPGERKALRKRIVLSNTNALDVQGLQDMTGDKLMRHEPGSVALQSHQGQVLGLTNDTVDALRALEAFKPTQAWSLFRRPASLVRAETAQLANDLADVIGEKKTVRKIVFGAAGSGKSTLLLQAHAMARLRDCVVVHFPEAQDLTNGNIAYQPLTTPQGTIYVQPDYTAQLLGNTARANHALLSTLRISQQHQLPTPIQPNISLARFAELGANDPQLAWPIWQALWSELTTPSKPDVEGLTRPPVLVSMDGVDQAMRMSAFLDRDAKPIHAHDLALPQHFMSLLSGQTSLPNGGMVLAATCESNRAASPTLYHHLHLKHAQQQKSASPPAWDPFKPQDSRVAAATNNAQVLKLEGLSKEEARGVMEYYAQSGILRSAVTETLVSEKWSLAGAGIIGELERATVRARF